MEVDAYLQGAGQLLQLRGQQPMNPGLVLLGRPYRPSLIKEGPKLTTGSDA